MSIKLELIFDGIHKPAELMHQAIAAIKNEDSSNKTDNRPGHSAFIKETEVIAKTLEKSWMAICQSLPLTTNPHEVNYEELYKDPDLDQTKLAHDLRDIDVETLEKAATCIRDNGFQQYLDHNSEHFNWIADRTEELVTQLTQKTENTAIRPYDIN